MRARDAMVTQPRSLGVDATAQEAGELLARPEVRAIFVCDQERLVGVVTRKTLVREVVARGLAPGETRLADIAEEPHWTIDGDMPVEEAFRFLEEGGRRVGVLSRSVLQRRLAEDETEPDELPAGV